MRFKDLALSAVLGTAALLTQLIVVPSNAAADAPPANDGSSLERAAVSCWDIKQTTPTAPDGAYWLLTPTLQAPQQFYCDMTYDGGGWVLIGKGREDWQDAYIGQGDSAKLLTPTRVPATFEAVQLPATTIDGLMNGGRVDAMTSGVRILRAKDAAGSTWQNVNFGWAQRDRWVWTIPAAHAMQWFRFDNAAKVNGGGTSNFGSDNSYRRSIFSYSAAQNWKAGFAYGSGVGGGANNATTYLWTANSNGTAPLPYSEVYIRPKLTAADTAFSVIPDTGSNSSAQRSVASSFAAPGSWGVTGHFNGRVSEGNAEVQDFAQIDNTVFVAGNFQYVQRGANATGSNLVTQPALAAFNATNGDFLPNFRPVFNGQVKAIINLPNGKLLAGGDFTVVNGQPAKGTVLLDAATGATAAGWNVQMENRISTGVLTIRDLSINGDYVYVGGAFTHMTGGTQTTSMYARHAARIKWSTGTPDKTWNPEFDGTVVDTDVSADGSRLYAAGYFTLSQGAYANKAAAVQTIAGAPLATPTWTTVWSSSDRSGYQQAIKATGSTVYVGGSEHSIFGYDTSTFQRVNGSTTNGIGGDFQAIDSSSTVVYGGCHCANWAYQNSFTWPSPGPSWTQADKIQWIGAWDSATGAFIPGFNPPALQSNNAGVWAIFVAADGTVWSGGDLTGARTSPTASQWVGGFVRFPLNDSTAPTAPSNLRSTASTATSVSLAWTGSTDAGSAVSYEILRNDRVIATSTSLAATVPTYSSTDKFFVRAIDSSKNRSASSAVLGTPPPPDPEPEPGNPTLIAAGSQWQYSNLTTAPATDWKLSSFDASSWTTGAAPLGFGATGLLSNIDVPAPTSNRPIVNYFRRDFTVADASKVATLTLNTLADDGQVVYVNGTEVSRTRIATGSVGNTTYANAAVSTTTARANPVVVSVPVNLLVTGKNTVAVSAHVNYRGTPNLSFELSATATYADPAPVDPPVDPAPVDPPVDPAPVDPPVDPAPVNPTPVSILANGDSWNYQYGATAPAANWATAIFDSSTWASGATPVGFGAAGIATDINVPAANRTPVAYFRKSVDIANVGTVTGLTLTTVADDGIVVYVNGTEVGRSRVSAGTVTNNTYASAAVSTAVANATPVVISVPPGLLVEGANVIAVSTHLNYKSTPNISFSMSATVTR